MQKNEQENLNDDKKQIIEQILTEFKDFIFENDYDFRVQVYRDDFEKFVKRIKRENGLLPKYQTLREYISDHTCGSYHHFVFYLSSIKVNVCSVWDFEYYYQPHFLDDYVVIKDEKSDNGGNVEQYEATHELTIEKKEET